MDKVLVALMVVLAALASASSERRKRFLVMPPTSPTRHQLIAGIGIPLNLEDQAITLGIVLKAQYLLVRLIDPN
jgi:hypothetical protein